MLTVPIAQVRNLYLLYPTQCLPHSWYLVFAECLLNTFMETAVKSDSQLLYRPRNE